MALFSVDFTSTPANLLADLNTQLANATDWARPNSGSRANTWKATTTRGADMVLDFNPEAINGAWMAIQAYASYDGTTLGAAAPRRYIRWAEDGATSRTIRVHLSVSKEHFYMEIEGPRYSETGADNGTYGSMRRCFFIGDLVPYLPSGVDNVPAVTLVGHSGTSQNDNSNGLYWKIYTSKSIGGVLWSPGWLMTLCSPANTAMDSAQRVTADGNVYLAPYVVLDDNDGVRGRLANCFFAGWNYPAVDYAIPSLVAGSKVTYGGLTFRLRACFRGAGNYRDLRSPFGGGGSGTNATPNTFFSPIIAIPIQ